MEDTRYVDYFETALSAAPATGNDRVDTIRSLSAHIEANLVAQNLPPDIHEAELELARAAADKLLSDLQDDFAGDAAAAAAIAAAGAAKPDFDWRARITRRAIAIAVGCLLIYALPLIFFVREGRDAKTVDARGAEIALRVSVGVTHLQEEKLAIHIKPASGALFKDGMLTEDVEVRLDPGTGPMTHTFPARTHLTAWDVTVIADSGDILNYPFDHYRFDFDCEAFVKGKPIVLAAGLGSTPHGIRATLTDVKGLGSDDDISLEVTRSGSVDFRP